MYRELDIGVAKPTPAQLAAADHHLISYVGINEAYSAGHWARDAADTLARVFERHDFAIVAGGSGLHVRALLEGIPDMPPVPPGVRAHYAAVLARDGLSALQEELRRKDPAYAATADMANPRRIQRALEVLAAGGETFTELRARPREPLPYRSDWVVLDPERDGLSARIDERVRDMFSRGLVDEARGLSPKRHLDALQTIGYRELWPHVDGEASRAEAIAAVQRATRRYARRQATWNRRLQGLRLREPNAERVLTEFI